MRGNQPDQHLADAVHVAHDGETLVRRLLERATECVDALALAEVVRRRAHDLGHVVEMQARGACGLVREERRALHLQKRVVQGLVQKVRGPLRDGDAEEDGEEVLLADISMTIRRETVRRVTPPMKAPAPSSKHPGIDPRRGDPSRGEIRLGVPPADGEVEEHQTHETTHRRAP